MFKLTIHIDEDIFILKDSFILNMKYPTDVINITFTGKCDSLGAEKSVILLDMDGSIFIDEPLHQSYMRLQCLKITSTKGFVNSTKMFIRDQLSFVEINRVAFRNIYLPPVKIIFMSVQKVSDCIFSNITAPLDGNVFTFISGIQWGISNCIFEDFLYYDTFNLITFHGYDNVLFENIIVRRMKVFQIEDHIHSIPSFYIFNGVSTKNLTFNKINVSESHIHFGVINVYAPIENTVKFLNNDFKHIVMSQRFIELSILKVSNIVFENCKFLYFTKFGEDVQYIQYDNGFSMMYFVRSNSQLETNLVFKNVEIAHIDIAIKLAGGSSFMNPYFNYILTHNVQNVFLKNMHVHNNTNQLLHYFREDNFEGNIVIKNSKFVDNVIYNEHGDFVGYTSNRRIEIPNSLFFNSIHNMDTVESINYPTNMYVSSSIFERNYMIYYKRFSYFNGNYECKNEFHMVCDGLYEKSKYSNVNFLENSFFKVSGQTSQCLKDNFDLECMEYYTLNAIGQALFSTLIMFLIISALCLPIVAIVLISVGIYSYVKISKQKSKIKKYDGIEDIDLILQEQEALKGENHLAKFSINKKLFEIDFEKDIRLLKLIGDGGSNSKVFLCEWKGKQAAYKAFHSSVIAEMNSQSDFDTFEKEVSLLSSLAHPNILTFFGCTLAPRVGILMEFCALGELGTFILSFKKNNSFKYPIHEKIRLLLDVANGMEHIHSLNIIHRDLKPQNILIVEGTLTAKIMDFGLSRLSQNQSDLKTRRVGTSYFMAPEVFTGSMYDSSCDVFSFGIIIHCLISENFSTPYGSDTDHSGIELKVAKDPNFRPPINEDDFVNVQFLKSLMESCYAHDSRQRPSFKSVIDVLTKNKSKSYDKKNDVAFLKEGNEKIIQEKDDEILLLKNKICELEKVVKKSEDEITSLKKKFKEMEKNEKIVEEEEV